MIITSLFRKIEAQLSDTPKYLGMKFFSLDVKLWASNVSVIHTETNSLVIESFL